MDTLEITQILYNYCLDMDQNDYNETSEKEIKEIEDALYYIKVLSQNEYNKKGFKMLLNMLEILAELLKNEK